LIKGASQDGPRIRLLQIAESLAMNGCEVVFLSRGRSVSPTAVNRVKFECWDNFKDLRRFLLKANIVIASYAALGLNKMILSTLTRDQILIADAIVPIMAENVSRKIKEDLDQQCLAQFLKRSQLTLVSSKNLKKFYDDFIERTLKVQEHSGNYFLFPFMHPSVDSVLPHSDDSSTLRLLYYGGIYPWFGIKEFENFLNKFPHSNAQIRLTIAGLINPNLNDQEIREATEKIIIAGWNNPNICFKPWIPSSMRTEFLGAFDAAIFFNNPQKEETSVSWRTRYADLVNAKLPLVVNSTDPFSQLMIDNGICRVFENDELRACFGSVDKVRKIKTEFNEMKKNGRWEDLQIELSAEKLGFLLKEEVLNLWEIKN
jgi:hypothetical protein